MKRAVVPAKAGTHRASNKIATAAVMAMLLVSPSNTVAADWSGFAALEYRGFAHAPLDAVQQRNHFSLAVQPEFVHEIEGSKDSLRFTAFARADRYDDERSHADVRELAWLNVGERHEWRVGIRKVFWGVTEAQHLVDVVNQTDLVENLDGEDKLGQPMVNLALFRDWGALDLFVLPYFRERTFPGSEGRLRTQPRVDTDRPVYESARAQRHVDYAARWAKYWRGVDVGLTYFAGTNRSPRLVADLNDNGEIVLIPHYDQLRQAGVDVTAATDAWLWKLEAVYRDSYGPSYYASSAGFEYTFSGVFDSGADIGVLMEYLYDERGADAPAPFQDDVLLGLRLALNDAQSSDLLVGVIVDRRSDARFFSLEASRRLADSWKLNIEARAFAGTPPADPFFSLRRDDYMQLEIVRYF